MHIKCWGSRGSIPVSGREYLKYGGDTTCIEVVAASGETVIIDAGTGIRKLGCVCSKARTTPLYLLFTHAHGDHVIGFNFFKPLLDSRSTILIQNHRFSGFSVKEILSRLMEPPLFPITIDQMHADIQFRDDLAGDISIGSMAITSIPLSHPNGGFGYKFTENSKSFVFLTDNELGFHHPGSRGFDSFLKFSENADLLIHDAEFTPDEYLSRKGWGHSSYRDTLELAIKADIKHLGLFHINQERSDDDMDRIVDICRSIIKKKGITLDCSGIGTGFEYDL